MKMRRRINYFSLTVAFTVLWASLDLLYITIQIYSLKNSTIIDSSTALQSLKSFFLSKPFLNTDPGGSYFSVHASEFLYILLQVVSLKFTIISIYLVQAVITFGASIPLFLIARKHLRDERSSFFLSIAYLIFPYIQTDVFELLTLFMGLIIFSFYFLENRHFIAFMITFLLALSTMEFAPFLGVSIGLYLILVYFLRTRTATSSRGSRIKSLWNKVWKFIIEFKSNRGAQLGVLLAIVSFAFYIIDSHVIALFSGGTHNITSNLAGAGGNLLPTLPSKLESFLQLNSPFALMSFFDPVWLLELPWALASGITTFGPYWDPGVYYDSYLIPFIAISAIFGIQRLSSFFSAESARKKFLRYISGLILAVSLVSMISITLVPMTQSIQPSATVKGSEVSQLASLIPNGAGVYTGANELPIVSSHTWNTWIFGDREEYTLFNVSNGPPYNVSLNGFVGASGSYVLYGSNYSQQPVFNDLQINSSLPGAALSPLSDSASVYLPPGSYEINASIDYKSVNIFKDEIGSGNVSSVYMPEKYVVLQPFTVNTPVNLSEIIVPATMYPGYFILQSEITVGDNLNNVVAQDSIGRNEYNTPFLQFSFSGQELLPNVTYDFWLWSSGVPGGLYVPLSSNSSSASASMAVIYSGSGYDSYGYYFGSYSNMSRLNESLEFTIVGSSVDRIGSIYPSLISLDIGNEKTNITIASDRTISLTVKHNLSSEFTFTASSSFLNGTLKGISISILSATFQNSRAPHEISLLPWLALIFLMFMLLLVLSFTDIRIPIYRTVRKISQFLMGTSFVLFYILLAYYYYVLSFNFTVLRIVVYVELISLFTFLLFGNYIGSSDQQEGFPISVYDDQ